MTSMELFPGAHEYLVRQMTWEADDVVSVVLVNPDGREMPAWTLGAHIDLILRPDLIRQYSLCSDPTDRSKWTIAILREPNSGGGSRFIHEVLRPGMTIAAGDPRNNFPLVEAAHYLFVAGGIGVTPLLPMVLALQETGRDWTMLYGGRRRASMAFLDQLGPLGNVTIAPEDEFGLLDLKGAIESTPDDTAIYCCGPEPLIAALEAQCERSGRSAPHVERFNARPSFAAETHEGENAEFELVLAKSGRRFTIPADKTIIQVLSAERVFVATSCTEGYCGVCETAVLEGIPDHRDDYLLPEVRDTNKRIMVCCSRSKTPELVIDL